MASGRVSTNVTAGPSPYLGRPGNFDAYPSHRSGRSPYNMMGATTAGSGYMHGPPRDYTWAFGRQVIYADVLDVSADQTVSPPAATASASAPVPTLQVQVLPAAATANASAPTPTAQLQVLPAAATASASALVPVPQVRALPPAATASSSAPTPIPSVKVSPAAATASASAPVPTVSTATAPQNSIPTNAQLDYGGLGNFALGMSRPLASSNQTVSAPAATASASALVPVPQVRVLPAAATASASAPVPTVSVRILPAAATASASAPIPGLAVRILPAAASAAASAPVPTVTTGASITDTIQPNAQLDYGGLGNFALGMSRPLTVVGNQTVSPPAATAAASALVPTIQVRVSPAVASATASAPLPLVQLSILPGAATASASAPIPGTVGNRLQIQVAIPAATASASAPVPTVTSASASQTVSVPLAVATASAPIPGVLIPVVSWAIGGAWSSAWGFKPNAPEPSTPLEIHVPPQPAEPLR